MNHRQQGLKVWNCYWCLLWFTCIHLSDLLLSVYASIHPAHISAFTWLCSTEGLLHVIGLPIPLNSFLAQQAQRKNFCLPMSSHHSRQGLWLALLGSHVHPQEQSEQKKIGYYDWLYLPTSLERAVGSYPLENRGGTRERKLYCIAKRNILIDC